MLFLLNLFHDMSGAERYIEIKAQCKVFIYLNFLYGIWLSCSVGCGLTEHGILLLPVVPLLINSPNNCDSVKVFLFLCYNDIILFT